MLRNVAIAQGSGVGIGEGTAGDMQGDTLKRGSSMILGFKHLPGSALPKAWQNRFVVLRFTSA